MTSPKFPECFSRFERVVDIRKIRDYDELRMEFIHWAKSPAYGLSTRQNMALKDEADARGIEDTYVVRRQLVSRRGRFVIIARNMKTGRFAKNVWYR